MQHSAACQEERGCVHSVTEGVRIRPGSRSSGQDEGRTQWSQASTGGCGRARWGPWSVYETVSVRRTPGASCSYWLSPWGLESAAAGCPRGSLFLEQGLRTLPVHTPEGDAPVGTLPRSRELGIWGKGARPHDGRVCVKQPVPFPLTSCGNIFVSVQDIAINWLGV